MNCWIKCGNFLLLLFFIFSFSNSWKVMDVLWERFDWSVMEAGDGISKGSLHGYHFSWLDSFVVGSTQASASHWIQPNSTEVSTRMAFIPEQLRCTFSPIWEPCRNNFQTIPSRFAFIGSSFSAPPPFFFSINCSMELAAGSQRFIKFRNIFPPIWRWLQSRLDIHFSR